MRVAIGNDHGGLALRAVLVELLESLGHEAVDFGTDEPQAVDYPVFAARAARAVRDGEADLAIVICGTGIGSSIAANKVRGVYCALCSDVYSARMARSHNAANVIALGARVVGVGLATEIVRTFLETEPSAEPRHVRRRELVRKLEDGSDLAAQE